jgi:hypothetical protein
MPFVRANPSEYLLTGRGGRLENRGSAVQAFVLPGSVWVVVPAAKTEAAFEFTQETRDGIPLRFKGIVVYRVTDPLAAAQQFNFSAGTGLSGVSNVLTHVCLGELRHAVSHMTMVECIEQRKTTLSGVVATALDEALHPTNGADWGITVEVAQVAQVFIVDAELRSQLEAEVRNEIKLHSDRSAIRAAEETRATEMESADRVGDRSLAADQEALRREEALEIARMTRDRRLAVERLESERQSLELDVSRARARVENEELRIGLEAPLRLLKNQRDAEVAQSERRLRRLQADVEAVEVERRMAMPRAEHELRREMLPIEQAPAIAESASRVFQGTSLSVYGDGSELMGQVAPLLDGLSRALSRSAGTEPMRAAPATPTS